MAELLGVQERRLKTWREKGFPGHKVGRDVYYDVEAACRWIEAQP